MNRRTLLQSVPAALAMPLAAAPKIDSSAGFYFLTDENEHLRPELLSSGEQHELVVLYELLFKTDSNDNALQASGWGGFQGNICFYP